MSSVADATSLPREWDSRFHGVVSNFGIMLVPDRAKALKEALRVLKPGGWCAVTTWKMDASNLVQDDPAGIGLAVALKQLAASYDDKSKEHPELQEKMQNMGLDSLVQCFESVGFTNILSRPVVGSVIMGTANKVLRPVKAGEEITVHYGDAYWEWVEEHLGFACMCCN